MISDQLRNVAICRDYAAGADIDDLCKKYHPKHGPRRPLSRLRILEILGENAIALRPRDKCPPCPPPQDLANRDPEIRQRYAEGYSLESVGAAYGLTRARIDQIVNSTTNTVPRILKERRDQRILQAYADGATTEEIAAQEKMGHSRVHAIYQRAERRGAVPEPTILSVPVIVAGAGWGANVRASLERRLALQREIGESSKKQELEKELCRRDVVRFVSNWGWTYDPRRVESDLPAWMPFDLFPRQVEMIRFIEARMTIGEDGLIEKSRDIGFTWVAGAVALHRWLYFPGFKTQFGSHLEEQVDRLGDSDSIFEKIRMMLYRLPPWMHPKGFFSPDHDNQLRLVNPESDNTITGKAGDQIGRGGRSSLLIIDEAAHVERAERVDASSAATTNCRIWASSVNGMGNLFARKRFGGALRPEQVFRFHWRDDPRKTDEWAEKKQRELIATPWAWAAEYEIDYSASVEGVCIPAKWVQAATRLKALLDDELLRDEGQMRAPGYRSPEAAIAGLDVGGGKAQSVFIVRRGPVVEMPISWLSPDTTNTALRALEEAKKRGVAKLNFDSVGIGQGVLSTLTLTDTGGVLTEGINVGVPPSMTMWDDGKNSRQKFQNLKAEVWWIARERFRRTWEHVNFLDGAEEDAQEHMVDDLIMIPPEATQLITQLSLPRSFRNERGRVIMESKVQLATRGVASPDEAEALMLTLAPGEPVLTFAPMFIEDGPMPDAWSNRG